MFCPRCGQQQISAATRFCSRCGLPLGIVAEVLAGDGTIPQLADLNKPKKLLTRRNVSRFGLAWFLFITFLLVPLAGIIGMDEGAGALAIIGMMGGALIMIFARLFLEPEPKLSPALAYQANNQLRGNAAGNALPPSQTYPANDFVPPANSWRTPETGDFSNVPSVTDHTTKLLQKDE